jgi:hypothetical protein
MTTLLGRNQMSTNTKYIAGLIAALLIAVVAITFPSRPTMQKNEKEAYTMRQFEFLDDYSGESTEELIALEGKYRIDSLILAFEQAIDQKANKIGLKELTNEERIILAVEALEREVNNGGYSQFFINPSQEYAPIIEDALIKIGCPETAKLTRRAIEALELPGPVTTEAVEKAIFTENQARDDKLNECDELYYKGDEDIAGNLFEFIKNNKDRIILDNNE